MKFKNYFIGLILITFLLAGCNSESETLDQNNVEEEVVDEEATVVEDSYEREYVLVNDANLDNLDENLERPQDLNVGDVGLILEDEGELLLVDFIRPVGDLPEDWSFARGYVPKENTIINPSEDDLKEFSNVARLKDGEITLEDSLNGDEFTEEGNKYVNIVDRENDRLLIEMSGGRNNAWVSTSDVDYNLEHFDGYPD